MSVNFDDVQVGDQLPKWSRKTSFAEWNRYAAVNEEFVPFHMDDEAGRRAGNEQGAFGMGNLRYAYIVNALHAWIGDEAPYAKSVASIARSTRKTTCSRWSARSPKSAPKTAKSVSTSTSTWSPSTAPPRAPATR